MTGILEYRGRPGGFESSPVRYAFIRHPKTWAKYYAAAAAFDGGRVPERGTVLEFDVDELGDPRGPVARHIRIVSAPVPSAWRRCRGCEQAFEIDVCMRAWFETFKQISLPWWCADCRAARPGSLEMQ